MIVSRSPFRITLGGGGTDLPAFYEKYGGSVTSMALDKYIYVSLKKNLLDENVRLQYLKTEYVKNTNQLKHTRAREALNHFNITNACEVSSMADLPSKSGLGSSGSYLVALINCLQELSKENLSKHQIASLACHIEMDILKEPVGKQDQFIASYGGIRTFNIDKTGAVSVEDINISDADIKEFTNRCRIYFTGFQRDASTVLKSQIKNKINFEEKMLKIMDLGYRFSEALKNKEYDKYGQLLDEHWKYKKMLSNKMTNKKIDDVYNFLKNEKLILGGKIIGAGGGGFLLVYAPNRFDKVDSYIESSGFVKLNYSLDKDGVKTMVLDK